MIGFLKKRIENYKDYKKRSERLLEKLKKRQQKLRLETTNEELAKMSKQQLKEKVKQIVEEQGKLELAVRLLRDEYKEGVKYRFPYTLVVLFMLLLLLVGFANASSSILSGIVYSVFSTAIGAILGSILAAYLLVIFVMTPDENYISIKLQLIELELAEMKKERREMKKLLAKVKSSL